MAGYPINRNWRSFTAQVDSCVRPTCRRCCVLCRHCWYVYRHVCIDSLRELLLGAFFTFLRSVDIANNCYESTLHVFIRSYKHRSRTCIHRDSKRMMTNCGDNFATPCLNLFKTRSQAVARIADRTASQHLWRSRDVIGHLTIWKPICHFLLVVLWNQGSISNGFRCIQRQM